MKRIKSKSIPVYFKGSLYCNRMLKYFDNSIFFCFNVIFFSINVLIKEMLKKLLAILVSSIALLAVNIIVLLIGISESWNERNFVLVYFTQSIFIGIFQFAKTVSLKKISTKNFVIYEYSVEPSKKEKLQNAIFFLFNFLFYLFIYFIIIFFLTNSQFNLTTGVTLAVLLFFANHLFSFLINFEEDRKRKLNLGQLITMPYLRVIPLNVTAILSLFVPGWHLLFVIVKIFLDTSLHVFEHTLEKSEI